jgi:diguanylate cyclase (GGDEF)-like protein
MLRTDLERVAPSRPFEPVAPRATRVGERADALRAVGALLPHKDPTEGAFVCFGVDNFRYVNASHGGETGDEVLSAVAGALAGALPAAQVFRLGGDLFGVLAPAGQLPEVVRTTERVLAVVRSMAIRAPGAEVRITLSAGILALADGGASAADALARADMAMAVAKTQGRDRVELYRVPTQTTLATTGTWGDCIRRALECDGFDLYCQPIQSLRSGSRHWELLLRMPQAGGELLSPTAFLPVAERFGLVESLDRWVVAQAVDTIAEHARQGNNVTLEVNVSVRSLLDDQFVGTVADALRSAHVAPSQLILEVNEGDIGVNVHEVRHAAGRLRSLGCRFALDNFGAEHGSLAHLKHLPLDFIKIDGRFIRHLAVDEVDQTIVRASIDLSHALGSQVTAVQVGDDESIALLRSYGADFVQGFHVGRPQPVGALR